MILVGRTASREACCAMHCPTRPSAIGVADDDLELFFFQDLTSVHPYHVDSLLQLSEICKMSEDLQMAAELIGEFR